MPKAIRVTVWSEFIHEKSNPAVAKIYPNGMHSAIAGYLNKQTGIKAKAVSLDQPEQGLSAKVLAETDVLIWWGHVAHGQVRDEIVDRVQARVLEGMGLILLHSAHHSKIFKRLMGTSCDLKWREASEKERIWVIEPDHPIARGLPEHFELPEEEMYGERFDIPQPDELVFISWFKGGEVFRSGCTWRRGYGKVFYFRPGHELHPTFHNENVQLVIQNAVRWVAQTTARTVAGCPNVTKPLEKL